MSFELYKQGPIKNVKMEEYSESEYSENFLHS